MVLASELLYVASTTMLKVSLGLLLLRVLVKRWMQWTIWVVMAVSVIYGISYFFFLLFQCGNPSGFGVCLLVIRLRPVQSKLTIHSQRSSSVNACLDLRLKARLTYTLS